MGMNSPLKERFGVTRMMCRVETKDGKIPNKMFSPKTGDLRFRPLKPGTEARESTGVCPIPGYDDFEFNELIGFAVRTDKLTPDKTHRQMLIDELRRDQGRLEVVDEELRVAWSEEADREMDGHFSPKTTVTVCLYMPFGTPMGPIETKFYERGDFTGVMWVFTASDVVVKTVTQILGKAKIYLEFSSPWVALDLEEPKVMTGPKKPGKSFFGPMFFSTMIKEKQFHLNQTKINAKLIRPTPSDIERIGLARDAHADFQRYLNLNAEVEAVGLTHDRWSFNPQTYTYALKGLNIAGLTTDHEPTRLKEAVDGCRALFVWLDESFMELYEAGKLSRYNQDDDALDKIHPIFEKFGVNPDTKQEKSFRAALAKANISLEEYGPAAVILYRESQKKKRKSKQKK